jgi:hypothetical protein
VIKTWQAIASNRAHIHMASDDVKPARFGCLDAARWVVAAAMLDPRRRNNPQVVGKIRVEKVHITHANIIEPISFWCSKLGCIFWLYSSIYIDLLHEK